MQVSPWARLRSMPPPKCLPQSEFAPHPQIALIGRGRSGIIQTTGPRTVRSSTMSESTVFIPSAAKPPQFSFRPEVTPEMFELAKSLSPEVLVAVLADKTCAQPFLKLYHVLHRMQLVKVGDNRYVCANCHHSFSRLFSALRDELINITVTHLCPQR